MAAGKDSALAEGKTARTAAATTEKSSKVYPLYLIPQALAEEIHTKGDSIETISVKRTAGHSYKIETEFRIKTEIKNTETDSGGDGSDE
ncbi:MAG: hypothetical protein JXQ82_08115 [Methanomicrobiaceae archaeon]|nr:hypothetical protein [Methanomicrobiaceae archaeon]